MIEAPPQERVVERVITAPMSEAPRSVREWDMLQPEKRSPSPSKSRSHRSRRRSSPGFREDVFERREVRRSSPAREEVIERREIIEDDRGESNSIHAGPLALVLPERQRKTDRDIKAEIRALEAERKALKLERHVEKDRGRAERIRDTEVIIERDRPSEEIIEVKKDRKGRMSLVRKD